MYTHSPVWFQDLMTTVYGYSLHHQRYGGSFSRHLAEVRETQWWPVERMEALQNVRLAALVSHAYANTRYYHRLVREHLRGQRDHSEVLWVMINLELWCQTFLDQSQSG